MSSQRLLCLLSFLVCVNAQGAAKEVETVVVYGEIDPTPVHALTSMTAVVDKRELEQAGNTHASDFLHAVPGLWVSRGNGQEHLTALRSPVFTGAGSCGAFWMGVDGVALRAKGFCNANQLFDAHFEAAQTVEVYKGPYTALFGSNAQFGGIHLVLPKATEVEPGLSVEGDTLGFRRLHIATGGTSGAHALGGWATLAEDDGWRADSGYGQQKLDVKHHWQAGAWSAETGLSVMHLEQETAGYIFGTDAYKNDRLREGNDNPEAFRDVDAMRLYSRWTLSQGSDTWSFTPYVRSNSMAFLMHFVPWQPLEKNAHDSAGLSALWRHSLADGGSVYWLAETEYTDGELSEFQSSPAPFTPERFPQGMHYDYQVDAASLATGVGLNLPFASRWLLDTSVRYDWDRYDYHTREAAGWDCAEGVSGCRFYRPADQENEFENLSLDLGLNVKINQPVALFMRAANGFRIPQATELYRAQSSNIREIDSEKITSVELGTRISLDVWSFELAAYSMKTEDGIYQDPERNYVNGVATHHSGLEYDLSWQPNNHWQVRLRGEFARHTYANNPLTLGVDESNNVDGNFIDTAPEVQAAALVRWLPNEAVDLSLAWSRMGRYYLDPENVWTYPGHETINFRGSWQTGDWRLFGAVNNLLDSDYAERADVSFGELRYFPGAGVNASLGIEWSWH